MGGATLAQPRLPGGRALPLLSVNHARPHAFHFQFTDGLVSTFSYNGFEVGTGSREAIQVLPASLYLSLSGIRLRPYGRVDNRRLAALIQEMKKGFKVSEADGSATSHEPRLRPAAALPRSWFSV
jgi:hypothetical protein